MIQQAIRISNDLYGNDICSAHELAKGYTRPILSNSYSSKVPDEIDQAYKDLIAKNKINEDT